MWPALIAALRLALPASLGYFANDVFTFIGKTFTSFNIFNPDTGRVKTGYVVAFFVLGGFIIIILLAMFSGKRGKKMFTGLMWGMFLYQLLSAESSVHSLATALFTLTTGVGILTSQNSTYIPKYFWYTAATQLTGFKITVQGDGVIFDSDAPGLNHAGVNRLIGQVTNTYTFRLANGFIVNKNVLWEVTNSAAQTPTIFVDSDETKARGKEMYLQLIRQPLIGPGGTDLSDFAALHLPNLSATDYVNILWNDGTQQANMLRGDLQALLQLSQNVVNTPVYSIDNYGMRLKKINLQVGVTQVSYIQRWIAPVSNGMINQAPVARGN